MYRANSDKNHEMVIIQVGNRDVTNIVCIMKTQCAILIAFEAWSILKFFCLKRN